MNRRIVEVMGGEVNLWWLRQPGRKNASFQARPERTRVLDLLTTVPAILFLLVLFVCSGTAGADPVRVRFPEATVHGFLNMKTVDADIATTGDLLQEVHGDTIEARLLFRFKDGSLHDETVTFSQKGVFRMLTYHMVQRGPVFDDDLEVSLSRKDGGTYKVIAGRGKNPKHYDGHLDLPDDVYNGMVLTAVKNLAKGETRLVHIVAFTPKPRLIDLELAPIGDERQVVGDASRTVTRFAMRPKLGPVLGILASVAGKKPRNYESWFLMQDVPAFVRFEGPLYVKGHIWRIELTSPQPAKQVK